MNTPFTTKNDALTNAAAAVLYNEDLTTVKANVEKVKVGDKTNFGLVKDIGDTYISFKSKDTPVTKIAFNQRKIGSKDFVLDKLMKLESVEELDEAVYTPKIAEAKKAFLLVKELEADSFEEFLKAMYMHFEDAAADAAKDSEFNLIAKNFKIMYKAWSNREGN